MKKYLSLLLALVLVLATFSGCAKSEPKTETTPDTNAPATEAPTNSGDTTGTYEIALVTDVGNIDDKSFNEGTWNGVVAYAEANGKTYAYYRPSEDSTEARVESIQNAIEKGAKVVVCPGYMFAEAIAMVQTQSPETMFLALDVTSGDVGEVAENTALITYREEQAGYLAGYAAVMDGYTKLGFLGGMAVPAVVRFGYGFVQGADAAATELGTNVDIKYWYGNTFGPSDDVKIKMDGWYTDGTEVVFACGGGIYLSAVAAAEAAGAKVIGVDVDQSAEADLIITSAMKDLKNSTVVALTALFDNGGKWPAEYAGKQSVLGAAEGCVGLPTAEGSWRFNKFTTSEYDAIFAKMVSGELVVSDVTDTAPVVTTATVDYQG